MYYQKKKYKIKTTTMTKRILFMNIVSALPLPRLSCRIFVNVIDIASKDYYDTNRSYC